MGMMNALLGLLFGNDRNVLRDTVEVFRENTEAASMRESAYQVAALGQYATEFSMPKRGRFDRFMDGLNRLPRPAMALGTLGLFVAAMVDPIWFSARMQGIALVPEPLWWLMGAIVSFYFGARHQAKGQEFQSSIARTMARTGAVTANIRALNEMAATSERDPQVVGDNPALEEWKRSRDT